MIINGERWTPVFESVDDALGSSINADEQGDVEQQVISLVASTLNESEALLVLAKNAEDYLRVDQACGALAGKLSRVLGYNESLMYDVLRDRFKLSPRHKYTHHQRELETTRKQISLWKKSTQAWVDAAEQHALDQLEVEFRDAGFLHY